MAEESVPIDILFEILKHASKYDRAKTALTDSRVRTIYPDTPPLSREQYDKIKWYQENIALVTSPADIVSAFNTIRHFKEDFPDLTKYFYQKVDELIKNKSPQQIRETFNM
jgi:hypothetical protein